uniref:Uncharacterized protein n=1 Tax=Oryza rufipogon TaxID=4529 RepID=A0A0E0Q6Z3_ORYRU
MEKFVIKEMGKPPDWQDFVGIITFLLINSTINFIEENNASNVAAALMACLARKANVLPLTLNKLTVNKNFIDLSDPSWSECDHVYNIHPNI